MQKLKKCWSCGSEAEKKEHGFCSCSNKECRIFNYFFEVYVWNTRTKIILDEKKIEEILCTTTMRYVEPGIAENIASALKLQEKEIIVCS